MREDKYKNVSFLPIAMRWLYEYSLKRQIERSQRLLKSTALSDVIYNGFLHNSNQLGDKASLAPQNFDALERDIFTALCSPVIRRIDNDKTALRERLYNLPVLDKFLKDDRFERLKSLCEGKELVSFDAAHSFCKTLLDKLTDNQKALSGARYIKIIDKLNSQIDSALKSIWDNNGDEKRLRMINRIYNKEKQVQDLIRKLKREALCAVEAQVDDISDALEQAVDAAKDTHAVLSAWGLSAGTPEQLKADIPRIKNNEQLMAITRMLGRYKEIIAHKRKNGYAFGLGEKYDITFGNDINCCLSSELALLGAAETEILFIRKYEQKRLMQYRKRDPITKGVGDMIVLIDESDSTKSIAGWAKAFALAMLDIASKDRRKFALIHFSSRRKIRTDIFEPSRYTSEDMLAAAEHFFGGGTDFEAPLREALSLLENGYEKADITIITDGRCELPDDFCKELKNRLLEYTASVTGILLDKDNDCGKSLIPFCDRVYHTKEMSEDDVALAVINDKIY